MIGIAKRLGTSGLLASSALFSTLAISPVQAQSQTPALPTGGTVMAGNATIGAPSGGSMTIYQGSDKAIIDWAGFSIGGGGAVHFDNGAGATLNRVTGTDVSAIDGRLSASGSVWLLNPNGVVIGKDGVVDVGGSFVASTLGLSNSDFLAGRNVTLAGNSPAAVINLGRIGSLGGDIVLAAMRVENRGGIASPGGTTGLLAGTRILLADQRDDNGRFKVVIGGAGTSVTNSGSIAAAAAELRANGGSIYALAGDTRGIIRATGVSTRDGRVYLTAGTGGTIALSGTGITARAADGAGGTIMIGSADTGRTTIGTGVTLDASATRGAGGFIETSAAAITIADDIRVTTLSAGGAHGTWLIDPTDFVVAASGGDISGAALSANLAGGNIEIMSTQGAGGTNGDVIVRDAVSWSANTVLTLTAVRDIAINAAITASGASAGLVLNHGAGRGYSLNGGRVTLSGANATLRIDGQAYTLIRTAQQLQAMRDNLGGFYALAGDVDASATAGWNGGAGFDPVGTLSDQFTGTLAGLGHVVSGLTINRPQQPLVGLIGGLDGIVRDIGLLDVWVRGRNNVGGLIGANFGSVANVHITGAVSGISSVGGLVGASDSGNSVSNAYAASAVNGDISVGGLVGSNGGSVTNAYATGAVSGTEEVGGLLGANIGSVANVYATGAVNGDISVGGLLGTNIGSVVNVYATGAVNGDISVGGLVGINGGSVTNAYATGAVSGTSYVGGLIGYNFVRVINSYWDSFSTGQASGVGANFGTAINVNAVGTAANSAYSASSYANLDDAVWYKAEGMRPLLRSEWSTSITNAHQLQLMAMDLGASYTLARNIDASATAGLSDIWGPLGFAPVGNGTNPFTGTLNGQGHIVSELTINRPGQDYVGLFGWIGIGGSVRDIGLVGGSISGNVDVGALVGFNRGNVSNAYATGAVSGNYYIGGLVGYQNTGARISNAYATGAVSGNYYTGGLVGTQNSDATISNAYATGAVSGNTFIGGLVGFNFGNVGNTYATGAVSGTSYVGGLVGYTFNDTVTNSYWNTQTSGQATSAGGTGRTTAQMHLASTFAGWDFAGIWARPDATYLPELYGVSGVVGIVATAANISRVYGDANPALSGSFTTVGTGYWNSLTTGAVTFGTSATAQSGVGSYAITASGAAATRVQGGAARVVYVNDGTLTITPRALTVSADSLPRIYGDANPALTWTSSGLVNGDTLNGVLTTTATSGTGVGSYGITQGTLAATSNYALNFTGGTLTITPRALSLAADSLSRIYGDTNPALTWTSSGLVNGDTLTGALTTGASLTSGVGSYDITQGTLAASSNYTLGFTGGTLTITPRAITVAALGGTSIYGDGGINPGLAATNLANGEDVSVLTGLANSFGITGTSNAGTYGLTVTGTLTNGNYTVTSTSTSGGNWIVTPRSLSVTADSLLRIYGDANPALTWTSNGLVNGDTLSGALTTNADARSNAGGHAITKGTLAASSNYALSFTGGTLTITPRALTITALDASKLWGTPDPALNWALGGLGLVNGDTLSGRLARVAGDTPGDYAILQGSLAASANYAITFDPGLFTIQPVSIGANQPIERQPPIAAPAIAAAPTQPATCTETCLLPYPGGVGQDASIRFVEARK